MDSDAFALDLRAFKKFHRDVAQLAKSMSDWNAYRSASLPILKYRQSRDLDDGLKVFGQFATSAIRHQELFDLLPSFQVSLTAAAKATHGDGYSQFKSIQPFSLSAHEMAINRINIEVFSTQSFIRKNEGILDEQLVKEWWKFYMAKSDRGVVRGPSWVNSPLLNFADLERFVIEEAAEIANRYGEQVSEGQGASSPAQMSASEPLLGDSRNGEQPPAVDISHWPSKTQAAKEMEISIRELTKWISVGDVKAYPFGKEHKIDMVSLQNAHAKYYKDI